MGIRDWFRRKPGPRKIGRSKGGSDLLKYDGRAPSQHRVGFSGESTLDHVEERERVYAELFGESDNVFHELLPLVPHVDVYRFPPSGDRDFFTFVTGGMSDLPMSPPDELGADVRRAELVFYATEDREEYAEILRYLAHFPHDNHTWLHWGHTMPNGQPPEPLFETKDLDTMFFMPTIVEPDSSLGERLQIQGDPVNLVWCVPITTAECQFKLDEGAEALFELFDANEHPFAFYGDRRSYV